MYMEGVWEGLLRKGRGVILLLIPNLKIKLFLLAVSGLFPSNLRQKTHLKVQDKTFFFLLNSFL
jgi:hypothetical protein